MKSLSFLALPVALVFAASCSDEAGPRNNATPAGDAGADADPISTGGTELKVAVPETGRVFVKLGTEPAIVTPADPKTDKGWDIAFEGLDVYTNSGPSGSGQSRAFGPNDAVVFIGDVAPEVPDVLLTGDKTGGAFVRWYFYEGAPSHALHSRFHVFGVKDADKLFKVQVLSYYGERDGAPVSALFRVRWQQLLPASGATQEATNIDGTATGADAPNECLDLGSGVKASLSPTEALASSAWHLCFRRQNISVNGELGGPRNVGAVDLEAEKVATEKLGEILDKTPESEQARFDGINAGSFDGQTFRGDRVVSAFSGLWLKKGVTPPAPEQVAWLVIGADGKSKYLIGFARFEGATDKTPGTIVMRVKAVN
jgi:hypothetical protein